MGILNNTVFDCEGNKYQNIDDEPQVNINQIGNKLSDFEILQIINKQEEGKSNEHIVFKARSLINKKIYALKRYQNISTHIQQYFQKLILFEHPHIVKYYNYFYDQNENFYYLIMEYINNLDINCFISAQRKLKKQIPEIEIWNLLLQCLSALEYVKNINDNDQNIKFELINIFINNEKSTKIGLFNYNSETIQSNNYENGNLYLLWTYFYSMINPEFIPNMLQNINFENILNNLNYSKELQNVLIIIYKKSTQNIYNNQNINIYDEVKNQYLNKYNRNTSIKAILENLLCYDNLVTKINEKRNIILNNKYKFYNSFLFLSAFDSINNNNLINNLNYIYAEFRRSMALSYTKLVKENEVDPLLLLTFILNRLHKENNEANYGNQINNNNILYSQDNISGGINNDEKDRTNQTQMRDNFFSYFNSTMKSPISDLFMSFVKTERSCNSCQAKFFSFSNCLYIIFDISNRMGPFHLIKDGFFAQKESSKIIDTDEGDNNICEQCFTETKFEEKNNYYILKKNLIICFIRGKNYQNGNNIIFDNDLELKDFIETKNNSPHRFKLIGMVNRIYYNDIEQFVSRKPLNNNNNIQNEQIMMLFYQSHDMTN